MTSLYSRLFRYRQGLLRAPREDFLTEALAGVLDLVSRYESPDIIRDMFVPDALGADWDRVANSAKSIQVDTQFWIDENSRPDLVILADGHPLIVVENKISAPLRDNQLGRYRDWIATKATAIWPGVVCFLTHTTEPPSDFIRHGTSAPQLMVRRWGEIANLLRKFMAQPATNTVRRSLSGELLGFLMEENMTGEFADLEDFSAAFVYLRSSAKLSHTYHAIFDHIKKHGGYFSGDFQDDDPICQDTSLNLIWGWKFLKCEGLNSTFLGYGISLKPSLYLKGSGVPDQDSVFLCLGSDSEKEFARIQQGISKLELDWIIARGEDAAAAWGFLPLAPLLAQPQAFSTKMINWIDEVKPDIERVLKTISTIKS